MRGRAQVRASAPRSPQSCRQAKTSGGQANAVNPQPKAAGPQRGPGSSSAQVRAAHARASGRSASAVFPATPPFTCASRPNVSRTLARAHASMPLGGKPPPARRFSTRRLVPRVHRLVHRRRKVLRRGHHLSNAVRRLLARRKVLANRAKSVANRRHLVAAGRKPVARRRRFDPDGSHFGAGGRLSVRRRVQNVPTRGGALPNRRQTNPAPDGACAACCPSDPRCNRMEMLRVRPVRRPSHIRRGRIRFPPRRTRMTRQRRHEPAR